LTRRRVIALGIATLALVGFGWILTGPIVEFLGGDFAGPPEELKSGLSPRARALIDAAYEGIDADKRVDYHTHVVGLGAGGTGAQVNPEMTSWTSPTKRAKFSIYLSASGVSDLGNADAQYLDRLQKLIRHQQHPGRHAIMAFDRYYRPDGTVNPHKTEFYVPNAYVFSLAKSQPDIFVPVMSVHPYREDALEALRRWAGHGGRYVKWLPNAMGMTPDDAAIDPYYAVMKELDLVLIAHGGEEQAVDAEADQERGNPLRLRRPLDQGVKVVIAHCASLGTSEDLDAEGHPQASNFELFMRLMDDPKYEGLLFADISAMLQWNRLGEPLTTMLRRTDLHDRLVNGSDYPLPAINSLVSTWELERQEYITTAEREALNEIYAYNPLLFDFVAKRTVHAPGTGERFAPRVFEQHPEL
jgi:predicted TIM-barrel fold metal-dependent hydrolase